MWNETIAATRRRGGAPARALAGRLLTGPIAFLIAGLIDVLIALWWLRFRSRTGRTF
jgi:hypothetical protein